MSCTAEDHCSHVGSDQTNELDEDGADVEAASNIKFLELCQSSARLLLHFMEFICRICLCLDFGGKFNVRV